MTDRETTVTEDLHAAIELLRDIQHEANDKLVAADIEPGITSIENAIRKIQNLRCEAVAQLEKL